MAVRKTTKRLYLIPVLSKALDILELLQAENQPMTLEAIHRQTRISKTTVYRVLKTFVHRGYLSQSPDGLYRQVTRPKKMRFGFAGQSADMPFSNEVTESLKDAAASVGVDLLVLDNRYDAATALKNAEEFVRNKVDLVIEFQVEQEVAPMIGDKIAGAKIPLSAVDAVREQKRDKHVAIVGQDCIAEAIAEMRKDRSPLIGSVSHEASSYGPSLIHLGLSLLRGQTVPPYNYVAHKMVTRESLA